MFSAQGFAGRGGGAAPNTGSNFGGGGSNFGGGASSSPSGGQGGAKRQTQPIRPLSIKQLVNAQRVGDGVMVIDGREATQVTVLGRIVEHEGATAGGGMTAKHHGYKISDGTGTVVVRQWLDADRAQEILPIGHYVRASGSVKIWQDKPVVTGTVRNASDANELTFHLLDAVLTHLRITRGPVPQSAAPAVVSTAFNNVNQQHGAYGSDAVGGAGQKMFPNDVVTAIIKNFARTQNGSVGITQEEVAMQAQRHGTSISEVRTAMKSLLNEGKIFNVDNTHFTA